MRCRVRRLVWLSWLSVLLAAACGGGPAPDPAGTGQASAKPIDDTWRYFSDVERIDQLVVGEVDLWALTQVGLVRWSRKTGQLIAETGRDAPRRGLVGIARAPGGIIYAATRAALLVRGADGDWRRVEHPDLQGKISAIAAREAGGVWIGFAESGFGWYHDGQAKRVDRGHGVSALAIAGKKLWVGTIDRGVLGLQSDQLVEFTSGQGLCGNRISKLIGAGERLLALCSDPPALRRFSLWQGGRWYTYEIRGLRGRINDIAAVGAQIVLRVADRSLVLVPAPPVPAEGEPRPPAPIVAVPIDQVNVAEPPAPAPAPKKADEVASPEPAAPKPAAEIAAPEPAAPEPPGLPVHRAGAGAKGSIDQAPRLAVRAADLGLPRGVPISAQAFASDGTVYFAMTHRGVLAVKGRQRKRLATLSLLPTTEGTRLVLDAKGRALLTRNTNRLLRGTHEGWDYWPVGEQPDLQVLTAGADVSKQTWVVAFRPPQPAPPAEITPAGGSTPATGEPAPPAPAGARLQIFKAAAGSEAFLLLGTLPLTALDGPPRAGRLVIDSAGNLLFPLYWLDENGQFRGGGLARIPNTLDTVERWGSDIGFIAEQSEGTPVLPDLWVNAVVRSAAGDVTYVATNSGLARVRGEKVDVFDENTYLDSEVVLDVAIGADGRVWLATLEGLGSLAGDRWTPCKTRGLTGRVNVVSAGPRGALWAGTDEGLWRMGEDKKWKKVPVGGALVAAGAIRDIAPDPEGGLWVLTAQGVLHRKP